MCCRTAYDVYMKEPREIIEQDDGEYTHTLHSRPLNTNIPSITSVQSNLARGRIAGRSPLHDRITVTTAERKKVGVVVGLWL